MKPTITNEENATFDEIKSGLRSKYAKKLFSDLNDLKNVAMKRLFGALDDTVTAMLVENDELKKRCDIEKKEFYETEDYKSAQNKLVELKSQLSAEQNDEVKKEVEKKMSKALDRISTLNVTISNRLKKYTDKIKANDEALSTIFVSHDGKIGEAKRDFINAVDDVLQDCISEYNDELQSLRESFGIDDDGVDLPFDENQIKIELDFLPRLSGLVKANSERDDEDENSFSNIDEESTVKN